MADPKVKLAEAQLELADAEKRQQATWKPPYSPSNWDERHKIALEIKKIKAKINRLESAIIKAAGPILHHDMFKRPFVKGARVLWGQADSYAGFSTVYTVSHCTPKQVAILDPRPNTWRSNNPTFVYPDNLVVVDPLLPAGWTP